MISIIILTHNSAQFITPCLESIIKQKDNDVEIIIVDNTSQDNTLECIKAYDKYVQLIQNKDNLGPCRGRNQAIAKAQGDWILTLDCDVVLEHDFIYNLKQSIQSLSSQTGMVQPKILAPDKKTIYSCGIYLSWARRFFDIGHGQKNNGGFSRSKYIFGACAAAALYRKSMLDQIKEKTGYFDEAFFFFVEDVDIAWRAQRKGWKCFFVPEIVCTHAGNSTAYDRQFRQYYCLRNRYYLIKKNEGWLRYGLRILPVLFYDLPRSLYLLFTNPYVLKNCRHKSNTDKKGQ
ncbi:MAG: glycosyltransferase family 2 protein [bacterium]